MVEVVDDLPGVDAATLLPLVRTALNCPSTVLVGDWSCRPLGGGAGEGLGLYRVTGMAEVDAAPVPWALILKVCGAGDAGVASAWNYPPREALAYGSDLLRTLPAGLTAPRCLAVETRSGGTTWLWLEEVADAAPGPWSRDRFAQAARAFGRFNGAFVASAVLPSQPWLSRGWLRGFVAAAGPSLADLDRLTGPGGPPLVRQLYSPSFMAGLHRLWDEQETFLSALDRLPQTLCHQDAFRRNLLSRLGPAGEELVVLDWSNVGHTAVGTELAPLVVASLLFFEVNGISPRDLDTVCFAAYVDGLREAGWSGDVRQVRFGFCASAALRFILGVVRLALPSVADPALHAIAAAVFGRSMVEAVPLWADLWPYQFALADEARSLFPALSSSRSNPRRRHRDDQEV